MTTPLKPMDREAWEARLNLSHHTCEDPWYSCPKSPDGCANEHEGTECTCGADTHNKAVAEAIDHIITIQSQLTEALAEVERLRGDVAHERSINGFLMAAGNVLGNIAYNGAQSERVPEDYRKSMKDAVTDWDKAREKAKQPK